MALISCGRREARQEEGPAVAASPSLKEQPGVSPFVPGGGSGRVRTDPLRRQRAPEERGVRTLPPPPTDTTCSFWPPLGGPRDIPVLQMKCSGPVSWEERKKLAPEWPPRDARAAQYSPLCCVDRCLILLISSSTNMCWAPPWPGAVLGMGTRWGGKQTWFLLPSSLLLFGVLFPWVSCHLLESRTGQLTSSVFSELLPALSETLGAKQTSQDSQHGWGQGVQQPEPRQGGRLPGSATVRWHLSGETDVRAKAEADPGPGARENENGSARALRPVDQITSSVLGLQLWPVGVRWPSC